MGGSMSVFYLYGLPEQNVKKYGGADIRAGYCRFLGMIYASVECRVSSVECRVSSVECRVNYGARFEFVKYPAACFMRKPAALLSMF